VQFGISRTSRVTSETLVRLHQSIRCHIPEDNSLVLSEGSSIFYLSVLNLTTFSIYLGYTATNNSITCEQHLEETWQEVVVVYFNILSRHLTAGTEKTHETPVRTGFIIACINGHQVLMA
jgi:hypothetical protein